MNIKVEKSLIAKGKETHYEGIFNVNIGLSLESEELKEEYQLKEKGKLELISKTFPRIVITADSLGTAESKMPLPKYVFDSVHSIIEPFKSQLNRKIDCNGYNLEESYLTYPFTLICTIENIELTEKDLIYQIELLSDMIEASSDLVIGS